MDLFFYPKKICTRGESTVFSHVCVCVFLSGCIQLQHLSGISWALYAV